MKKEELRSICEPLMNLQTVEDCQQLLEKYINCFFKIMEHHHFDPVGTQAEADTKTIFQMFFTKALNIQNTLKGIEYKSGDYRLKNVIDPTILMTLTRNVFESLCAFEIVNIIPDTDDKKTILYNIYKLSGLKYRQRFNGPNASPEIQKIFAQEKLEIDESVDLIKKTTLYNSLDQKNRAVIDNAIKRRNYQIKIDSNSKVKLYGWGDIPPLFGANHTLLKEVYTLFSLNAHPSYVSMFQFRDMFNKENPEYINFSILCMSYFFSFLSIFLADYIKLFPNIGDTYMQFSVEDQILLNFHNKLIRGDNYSICDTWKQLEE